MITKHFMQKHNKAQSIVEYLVLFGVLVIVILVGAKSMASKTQRQYITAGKVVDETANAFARGMGVSPAQTVADAKIEKVKVKDLTYDLAYAYCDKACGAAGKSKGSCMNSCMESKGFK